jgi:hypothetical protein
MIKGNTWMLVSELLEIAKLEILFDVDLIVIKHSTIQSEIGMS